MRILNFGSLTAFLLYVFLLRLSIVFLKIVEIYSRKLRISPIFDDFSYKSHIVVASKLFLNVGAGFPRPQVTKALSKIAGRETKAFMLFPLQQFVRISHYSASNFSAEASFTHRQNRSIAICSSSMGGYEGAILMFLSSGSFL